MLRPALVLAAAKTCFFLLLPWLVVVEPAGTPHAISYLVNGSEHCLTLTNDPELAIGVVLAWLDEE